MNSAPSKMKSAATETSDEIRNSAECTALRAMTVNSPARIAASEKIQKKTDSQPDKIIADCRLPIADLKTLSNCSFALRFWRARLMLRYVTSPLSLPARWLRSAAAQLVSDSRVRLL